MHSTMIGNGLEAEADLERAHDGPAVRGQVAHHQPELDGIRGLAILCILLTHSSSIIAATPYTGLWYYLISLTVPLWGGVDLFFTLSGFLITNILLRSRHKPDYFKSFYARRALRIFPIYYLFLCVSLFVCTHVQTIAKVPGLLPTSTASRISFFFYLQNIPEFWVSLQTGILGLWGALWSLAVEEQFYLVWPSIVRWAEVRRLYVFCLLALVCGPLLRLWLVKSVTGPTLGLLHFPLARLDGLFAGAALTFYTRLRGKTLPVAWSVLWFSLGALTLMYIGKAHTAELSNPGPWMDILGVSGFVLVSAGLIASSQSRLRFPRNVLSTKPLTFLGKYSYGIYLYHLSFFLYLRSQRTTWLGDRFSHPWRGVAMEIAGCLCTVGVAVLSYRFIEAPFLALKKRFPSPATS